MLSLSRNMFVHTHTHTHMHMHMHMCTHTHTYTRTRTRTLTHTHTHVRLCLVIWGGRSAESCCMYVRARYCVCVCVCARAHLDAGYKDAQDALDCRSLSGKEPLIIGLFCAKELRKVNHPMRLHHPVGRVATSKIHRSTLQCTDPHCKTLQHTAIQCNTVQHCNTLQHTATHCNTQQHPATHCTATYCYTVQHMATYVAAMCNRRHSLHNQKPTATYCNTLQQAATFCNMLKDAAAQCNTPWPEVPGRIAKTAGAPNTTAPVCTYCIYIYTHVNKCIYQLYLYMWWGQGAQQALQARQRQLPLYAYVHIVYICMYIYAPIYMSHGA